MQRTTLEPFGPFAFLVVFGHALVGAGLWWWVTQQVPEMQASPGAGLVWMSPEDFSAADLNVEAPVVAKVADAVPTSPTEPDLPKAIAITPEQALAMMASAPPAQPPTPEPKPVVKVEPPAPPPTPKVETPPVKVPSTVITLTHQAPPPELKPQVASLLDLAALDAEGTGASGAASGFQVDEVDRAIIDGFKKNWLPPDASKLTPDQRAVQMQVAINREGRVISFKLLRPSGSEAMDSSVQKAADKLHKIDRALPPGYPGERYEVQINFHVE